MRSLVSACALVGLMLAAQAAAAADEAVAQYTLAQRASGASGERIDLDQAFRHLRRAAELGHLQAQVDLAFTYWNGNARVSRNLTESQAWFRQAAAGGSVRAECMLGDFHKLGLGGARQDAVEAVRWYRRSAASPDRCAPRSQYELYLAHLTGEGARKDLALAIGWLRKSAEAGNPVAQKTLGRHHSTGHGVRRDEPLARQWIARSREGVAPHDDVHEHGHASGRTGPAHHSH